MIQITSLKALLNYLLVLTILTLRAFIPGHAGTGVAVDSISTGASIKARVGRTLVDI